MNTTNSGLVDGIIELLQAKGYSVHEGVDAGRLDLGANAHWFVWGPNGGAGYETGESHTSKSAAWIDAIAHFFANAKITTDDAPPAARALDAQELATVLAALRYYQQAGMGEPGNRSIDIHDIATDGDTVVSLDDQGIDELCERLNLGEVGTVAPATHSDEPDAHGWRPSYGLQADAEGWGIFNDNTIQRDDEADVFAGDDEAIAFVRRRAAEGSQLHAAALRRCGLSAYTWRTAPHGGAHVMTNGEGADIGHAYLAPSGKWVGDPWGRATQYFDGPTAEADARAWVEKAFA